MFCKNKYQPQIPSWAKAEKMEISVPQIELWNRCRTDRGDASRPGAKK